MNVRSALWIAGLGLVFASSRPATAQTVTEVPLAAESPVVVDDAPVTAGGPGLMRFFKRADPSTPQRLWVSSEGLLMWTKSLNVPPLVTTGPAVNFTTNATPGTLGVVGTTPLVDKQIGFGPAAGGRFTVGGWVLPDVPVGLEVNYMYLGNGVGSRHLSENGQPGSQVLAFPFANAATGAESALLLAAPGSPGIAGTADVRTTTRLQGWEVLAGTDFGNFGRVHVVGLLGYRYLGLNESLQFSTSRRSNNPALDEVYRTEDVFVTTNAFHGGQLGLRADYGLGALTFYATGKVALGDIRQKSNISGSTLTNDFGTLQSFNSGLLAMGTNSGSSARDRIAVVPEFQFGAAYQPVCWLRLTLGYQGIFIGSVARPTDQIDRNINPSQSPAFLTSPSQALVGPARPALLPVPHSDFWAQGLTAGMEFKF